MSNATASAEAGQAGRTGGKFLTFFLASEEYGIEILKVQEIIGMMPVTPVPRTPPSIRGVINLRGKIIPVMDLRRKLSMPPTDATDRTCVIVVKAQGLEVGVIVDKVSEVLNIAQADTEDAPAFGQQVNTDFILGIGKTNGRVRLLLDIDKILSAQDVVDIQAARGKSQDSGADAGAAEPSQNKGA
jgi:purine-binding chemotaxis protein CheW